MTKGHASWFRGYSIPLAMTLGLACGSGESISTVSSANQTAAVGVASVPAVPRICSPGAEVSCAGPAACAGSQACSEDGAGYGTCYCRSDCAPGEALVYVIATNDVLYRFDPRSVSFVEVGALDCDISPMSMAVDRHGTAWVLSDEGELYQVDVATAACTKTMFVPGQQTFFKFGMSFVSDELGGLAETLYIGAERVLGTIDTQSLRVSRVGPWSLEASELTGNADGRLFAFSAPDSRSVVDVDKKTGEALRTTPQPTLGAYKTFAMAFWGGDLWLFTDSRVHRHRLIDRTTSLASSDIGFSIVGAGVSTCASTQ